MIAEVLPRKLADDAPKPVRLAILIDNGKHIARNYRVVGLMAISLMSTRIVRFHDADGNRLATIKLRRDCSTAKECRTPRERSWIPSVAR